MIAIHCGTDRENTPLIEQLISRNEDLQAERLAALADNDALTAENTRLRAELAEQAKQLATMRAA